MSRRRAPFPDDLIEQGQKLERDFEKSLLASRFGPALKTGAKMLVAARGPKKRKKLKQEKVLAILRADRNRRTDLVAKAVGCSRAYVNQLRKTLAEKKKN